MTIQTERQFKAFYGINQVLFKRLLNVFLLLYLEIAESTYEERKERYKNYGLTPRFREPNELTVERNLKLLLHYLKAAPTYDVLGSIFGIQQSSVQTIIEDNLIILLAALDFLEVLPRRSFDSPEELETYMKKHQVEDLFIDATERSYKRSTDKEEQKKYFSGKKKGHKIKNTIICSASKYILFIGLTFAGRSHDFSMLKVDFKTVIDWFKNFKIWIDLGYKGFDKNYTSKQTIIPHKKPRKSKNNPNPELTSEQKQENKEMSSKRVIVEHAIGRMKVFRILRDTYRGCHKMADWLIWAVGGLSNLKLTN